MNDTARIDTARQGHVLHITLHNPARRNAMCHSMWRDLGDALAGAASEPDLRALVLTGAGDKAFCAGNDISEFRTWRDDPEKHAAYEATSHRAMTLLRELPFPSIARIRGVCVGGGLEIALACDLRLADQASRFAITPARLGLGYKLEDVSLVVDTVGAAVARRLLFTARMHDAAEALRLGLVEEVHEASKLDAAVEDQQVEAAEHHGCPPGSADEGQREHLQPHGHVVGMADPAVGARANSRQPGDVDHLGVPAAAVQVE